MPMEKGRIIDASGRVFGRLNVIDAAGIVVIGLLIPLGLVAWLLFRTHPPEIVSIDPPVQQVGDNLRFTLHGRNLRPYMKAQLGTNPRTSLDFYLSAPDAAELKAPNPNKVPAGTYDLILLDEAKEVVRRVGGVTLQAPPPPPPAAPPSEPEHLTTMFMEVIGTFTGVDAPMAATIRKLRTFGEAGQPGSGELLMSEAPEPAAQRLRTLPFAGRPEQNVVAVRAWLRLRCGVVAGECRVRRTPVATNETLELIVNETAVRFVVMSVYPVAAASVAEVKTLGAFVGLEAGRAEAIMKGGATRQILAPLWGRVVSLGPIEPEVIRLKAGDREVSYGQTGKFRVRAVVALRCALAERECKAGSFVVSADSVFPLPTTEGLNFFEVEGLYAAEGPLLTDTKAEGRFMGLDAQRAAMLARLPPADRTLPESLGRILSLGSPEPEVVDFRDSGAQGTTGKFTVDGLISFRCAIVGSDCRFGSNFVSAGSILAVPTKLGVLTFAVKAPVPDTTPVHITVRCAVEPAMLARLRQQAAEDAAKAPDSSQPRLLAVKDVQENVMVHVTPFRRADERSSSYGWDEPGTMLTLVVVVPARRRDAAWEYDRTTLRVAERFVYNQPTFTVAGTITDVVVRPPGTQAIK